MLPLTGLDWKYLSPRPGRDAEGEEQSIVACPNLFALLEKQGKSTPFKLTKQSTVFGSSQYKQDGKPI